MANNEKKTVGVVMPIELYEEVQKMADLTQRTVPGYIRQVLKGRLPPVEPLHMKNSFPIEKKSKIGYTIPIPTEKWRKTAMTITKDTIIGDILTIAPQTAPLFMGIGMHCLGCPASRGETVEQACMVHGVDPDDLLAKVNEMIAAGE